MYTVLPYGDPLQVELRVSEGRLTICHLPERSAMVLDAGAAILIVCVVSEIWSRPKDTEMKGESQQ